MIQRLVSFALAQPLFTFLLAVLFVAGGIVAFKQLPIEAFPDVSDVQVTVITLFPGRAAEEVEKQVTIPIETELSGLPHSVRMFSHTQFGLSFIILTFDDGATDYFARQQVLERLKGASLPQEVEPELAPLTTPIGEIYRYRLQSGELDGRDLRSIQDWVVERHLKMVPGVADVVSFGGSIKQYQVGVDLAKLKSYNIALQDVFSALGKSNSNAGGSYIEQGSQIYLIRGIGLLRSSEDISNVVITQRQGTPILLRDVANVEVSSVPRQGVMGQDADDDIVTGIVVMRKGENPSLVLEALKDKVASLNETVLPKNVRLVPYYDRTWLIGTTLHTVGKNLIEGALLVTAILYLFLGNLRSAAIVAVIIPLALLATFIGLQIRGIPANLLSLGAMDFGIIVDGAVIVVENIFRRLSRDRADGGLESTRSAVLEATVQVGRPTFFSMLIIIIAHIPIFTLQRQEGRIFAPMAYTVTSALIGSLLFSLTLVPLLCFYLLRKRLPHEENIIARAAKRVYEPVLDWALSHRKTVIGAAVIALAAGLASSSFLGSEFLPELNEGTIWINVMLPSSISLTEAQKMCGTIRALVSESPEVRTVISKTGRPEDGTDPKLINMAEFFVDLKPRQEWRRTINKDKLLEEMEKRVLTIPGIDPSFSQPIRDNILESISQIDGQIVVKVFGPDGDILHEKAGQIVAAISGIRGVSRAFIDRAGRIPQLQIEINRERAARYGLNIADIQDVIETAIGGKTATEIWEGEKKFAVTVRLKEEDRADTPAIGKVLVDTPSGARVPLQELSTISVRDGQANIAREMGSRLAAIGVFIHGRDMGGVVSDAQKVVRDTVKLPPGYFITWGGEFENQQRAMARLKVIVPVSVFLIFLLLFNAFKSVKYAMLILLNVPFAVIGGVIALLVTAVPLSVSAAVGFIALFGQAVLNGVVMVTYFNQLRDRGLSALAAVREGALIRLRTVLMTALLASLGLLPAALSSGIGSETQKPLAIVIIGGLISATALTLIVLPTLYLIFNRASHDKDSNNGRTPEHFEARELDVNEQALLA
ncbi:MAG TPA: CusA/CzcA family heavy metal efflux RND transporter [Blastocatellia bacterium]|nr:CusA/CzcA family heavy metal efflux RND transporter [Blastocatellia bacterium]